jgi:hypothetical protein
MRWQRASTNRTLANGATFCRRAAHSSKDRATSCGKMRSRGKYHSCSLLSEFSFSGSSGKDDVTPMQLAFTFACLLLAVGCYVLAAVFGKDAATHDGLLVLAGALAGWVIPRLDGALAARKLLARLSPSPDEPNNGDVTSDADDTPSVKPPKDKGCLRVSVMAALALFLAPLLGGLTVFSAHASDTPTPTPQFGGCFSQGAICIGPSAAIVVGEFNLSTSKFSGGFIPGAGYGATFMANTWHTVGADLYLSFVVTHLAIFGVGSNFGGSTAYVQKTQARATPN